LKFNDCTHISEPGCAVLRALEAGEIDRSSYENFLKLEKRQKEKNFGKIRKDYKKEMKKKK